MKTYFKTNNKNMLYITPNEVNFISNNGKVSDQLPFGIYTIHSSPQKGMWLETGTITPYIPMVGLASNVERLMNKTWNSSTENCSVMLSGVSGNGKTRTAFNVSHNLKLPIILIQGQHPDLIMAVLNHIKNDVMLMYDEFEKHYDGDDQINSASLLSFLDGLQTSNRIYHVFTGNEVDKLSQYLFNRPGRILFNFKFESLEADVAFDFIRNRVQVPNEERLKEYILKLSDLSYDICQNIIGVIQRFGEDYVEALNHLNVKTGEIIYQMWGEKETYPILLHEIKLNEGWRYFHYDFNINGIHITFATKMSAQDIKFDPQGIYEIKRQDISIESSYYIKDNIDDNNVINDHEAIDITYNYIISNKIYIKRTFIPKSTGYHYLTF